MRIVDVYGIIYASIRGPSGLVESVIVPRRVYEVHETPRGPEIDVTVACQQIRIPLWPGDPVRELDDQKQFIFPEDQ